MRKVLESLYPGNKQTKTYLEEKYQKAGSRQHLYEEQFRCLQYKYRIVPIS